MSLGSDLKETYEEIGIKVTVDGDAEEYIDYAPNAQVTKPFIREFFIEGSIPYDTTQVVGSIVRFDIFNRDYMVMNLTPESLENEVYEYSGVFYMSNVSGEISRPSGEAVWDEESYQKKTSFETIQEDAYALMTEPLFGTDLDSQSELGNLSIEKDEMYIPTRYGIQALDRYQPASGEYREVTAVMKRRFSGMDVCKLSEDNR